MGCVELSRPDSVLVIGDAPGSPAEGMDVVCSRIVRGLSEAGHNVEVAPLRRVVRRPFRYLRQLLTSETRVVFTHGPGIGAALVSLALSRCRRARTAWICPRPQVPVWFQNRWTPPVDLLISNHVTGWYRSAGFEAPRRIFVGYDGTRLSGPGSQSASEPPSSRPGRVLHVGHVRRSRGLDSLAALKERFGPSVEVRLVSSPRFPVEAGVAEELHRSGVEIVKGFSSDLAAEYRWADVYLFPTDPGLGGAVELPLTVLEALHAGTPVVTTRFGAIEEALDDHAGVYFFDSGSESSMCDVVEKVLTDVGETIPQPLHLELQTVVDVLVAWSENGDVQ